MASGLFIGLTECELLDIKAKAVAMISMSLFSSMLIPILSGMILLAIGFNFRDKNAGVFSMWIGMLVILATVVIKILAKLNE